MLLEVGNTRTLVKSASATELEWLRELLAFVDQSKAFVRIGGSVQRVDPPAVTLLNETEPIPFFPSGLTTLAKTKGVEDPRIDEVIIADGRVRPVEPDFSVETPWVRPYQRESAVVAVEKTKGIISLPTGTGKTEVAVAISMMLPGATVLMITPEKDLLHNASRRYEKRTYEKAGRLGDSIYDPVPNGFTACTFQTLAAGLRKGDKKLIAYLATVDAIIIDEVHQLPADSFYSAAQSIPAYWRIGMSGTPLKRSDRKSLFSIAATGSIIYKKAPQFFIERGWLSQPKIRMVQVDQAGQAADWRGSYDAFVVNSVLRNRYLTQMAVLATKPGLLFVRHKKHGHAMVRYLKAAGLRTVFIWGDKSMSQRDQAIKQLEWGDLDVIVCNKVFVTGTDIPSLRSIVNGMGGKSVIETLQRLGRGTRVTDTKTEFEMWDVLDNAPDFRKGKLAGNRWNHTHSRDRKKAYLQEGYSVTVVSDLVVPR